MREILKKLFCLHPALKSEEYIPYGLFPETKIEYEHPWALFATRYTRYICNRCGKKYWYPSMNQEERKMDETLYNQLTTPLVIK